MATHHCIWFIFELMSFSSPLKEYYTFRIETSIIMDVLKPRSQREARTVSYLIRAAILHVYGTKDDASIPTPPLNPRVVTGMDVTQWDRFQRIMQKKNGQPYAQMIRNITNSIPVEYDEVQEKIQKFYRYWYQRDGRHYLNVNEEIYSLFM